MSAVWVLDQLGYPGEGGIDTRCFYTSQEAAVAGLKATYGDPYRVVWSESKDGFNGNLVLTGAFEAVLHYSTAHTAQWEVYEVEVR